ncbi:MAG: butyrate kinase [Bacteroidaceae bacterium]|nr:butyrate kinase [Bacteroidaceae bacterium]
MKILAINPGSTSTKIAVYEDENLIFLSNITHSIEELATFTEVSEQFDFRESLVMSELKSHGIAFRFHAIIGRGGLIKPMSGGVYEINEVLKYDTEHSTRMHACNLGVLIAYDLAKLIPGCKALMADPGVVDERSDVARISGTTLMPSITIWHALNQKAIARLYASEHGTRYENLDLIVCHLGGGISIAVHNHGRAIDANNALDGEGPFSPGRSGTVPFGQLIDLCYSGVFSKNELKRRLTSHSGLSAYLGTTDVPIIIERIKQGDKKAELVMDAMIYQIAKGIGAASVVLYGKIDAILLTGGLAYSDYVIERLKKRISFLAPVFVYPGENEMKALAMNALGALRGELPLKIYE